MRQLGGKRLVKRNVVISTAPAVIDTDASVVDSAEGTSLCTFVDPNEVKRKTYSGNHGLPSEKISFDCGVCHTSVAIYVENPEEFDEKARSHMFKDRGSSYSPPLCRWCLKKSKVTQ